MSIDRAVVEEFYRAMQQGDVETLLRILHPRFVCHVAPGMPLNAGGTHEGPQTAFENVWANVYAHYEIAPYAETWQQTTDGTFVVSGHYRGTARATGHPVEAEFVHLWKVTDGRISWLHQYTDTARWRAALSPA